MIDLNAEMAVVKNEVNRINAGERNSDFEYAVMADISEWIMLQPRTPMEMKNAINAFWNERLN